MVDVARRHDTLRKLEKRDFAIDPAHPDIDALQSAVQLEETFRTSAAHSDSLDRPADFRSWLAGAHQESEVLRDSLQRLRSGDSAALAPARRAFAAITKACADCHAQYRNQ
jgi:cytochrome c556